MPAMSSPNVRAATISHAARARASRRPYSSVESAVAGLAVDTGATPRRLGFLLGTCLPLVVWRVSFIVLDSALVCTCANVHLDASSFEQKAVFWPHWLLRLSDDKAATSHRSQNSVCRRRHCRASARRFPPLSPGSP